MKIAIAYLTSVIFAVFIQAVALWLIQELFKALNWWLLAIYFFVVKVIVWKISEALRWSFLWL